MADEPIWAKVGATDYGTTTIPHGFGAPRFDGKNAEIPAKSPHVDGDWRVVGWITSGGYGHSVKASLGQGYIPAELADREDEDLFEIEILGVRRPARINKEPLFDPAGARMWS